MRLPTISIAISRPDYELLRPGLELLAVGIANAKLGLFPRRNGWDRIDLVLSDIYQHRVFDAEMAARIISARGTVHNTRRTRKVQLDLLEVSVLALALRVSKSQSPKQPKGDGKNQEDALALKLEQHRKKAHRLAVKQLGLSDTRIAGNSWRAFVQWARYNLLQFKLAREPYHSLRPLWREKREALASMIQQALEEHCHAPLTADQMIRMVRLAKESFRRGRQPMTLRELLSAERQGRDLLFRFVESRLELTALPGAYVPPWKQAMERADRFNNYRDSLRHPIAATLP
jgi:hypothetical protein